MSNPPFLAGGAQTSLVAGGVVLLTEYAPVMVINPSLTATVWLAQDSNVSAGAGVPVAPSSAYVWQTAGPLYAVGDAADPVRVILTGSSDGWQPSPVAIGAAIAEQLAAEGITVNLTVTPLGVYTIPYQGIQGTFSLTIDPSQLGMPALSTFGTVLLVITAGGTGGAVTPVSYTWNGPDGVGVTFGPNLLPLSFGGGGGTPPSVTPLLPVYGQTLNLRNPNTDPMTVHIYGYNERVADNPVINGPSAMGFQGKATYVAGAGGFAQMFITSGEIFQGPASCYASISYASAHALDPGTVIVLSFNGVSDYYMIASASQMVSSTGSLYEVYFERAFPAAPFNLQAHLAGGLTAPVGMTINLQAIPNY